MYYVGSVGEGQWGVFKAEDTEPMCHSPIFESKKEAEDWCDFLNGC